MPKSERLSRRRFREPRIAARILQEKLMRTLIMAVQHASVDAALKMNCMEKKIQSFFLLAVFFFFAVRFYVSARNEGL